MNKIEIRTNVKTHTYARARVPSRVLTQLAVCKKKKGGTTNSDTLAKAIISRNATCGSFNADT